VRAWEDNEYEVLERTTNEVINALALHPGGIPRGPIYRGS
jgi:hypothetical protein